MAPLPPNNTARYLVNYRANGKEHTVQFRYGDGGVPGAPDLAFIGSVSAFLSAALPLLPSDFSVLTAFYIPSGGTVAFSTTPPTIVGTGAASVSDSEAPAYLTMVGRSDGGRRVRITLLGLGVSPAQEEGVYGDYRVTSSESTTVAALRTALDGSAVIGIDGDDVNWYGYANLGYNRHWQDEMRG